MNMSNGKIIEATLKSNIDLSAYADFVNNGRTDGVYFYVHGNSVTVWHPHTKLSEDFQRKELQWFLKGKEYDIN